MSAPPPTLLDLLSDRSQSLTDIARTLNIDPAILISQLNDPLRGIAPLLAAERARTQLLATQNLASTLHTLNLAAQHISTFIHSLIPPALSNAEGLAASPPLSSELSHPNSALSSVSSSAPLSSSSAAPSPADASSSSALSAQHSVLLLRSTDTLRRCAMLFERIASPRVLRERAGAAPHTAQHPHAFTTRPADLPSPSFDPHPAEHPAVPPQYSTLAPGTSYLYHPKNKCWYSWNLREKPVIAASPHSLAFRSSTHYHWDAQSQGWWIHTPFDRPTDPPLEFPHRRDPDYNYVAQPRPAAANIYRAAPHIPPSFLTAPLHTVAASAAPHDAIAPAQESKEDAKEEFKQELGQASDHAPDASSSPLHSEFSSSDPNAKCLVPSASSPQYSTITPVHTYPRLSDDAVSKILADLGRQRAAPLNDNDDTSQSTTPPPTHYPTSYLDPPHY